MIKELLTYLREKRHLLPEARTFGHLHESISLVAKEKRNRSAWRSHREQSKQFIIDQCQNLSHYDSVLVLGSGPLHEVPIEWLSQNFKDVFLVDIVHLRQTRKAVAGLNNITFIEHDISEMESSIDSTRRLIDRVPTKFLERQHSIVISANVMSQIPLHLYRFVAKHLKNKFNDIEIDDFLKRSCKNHLRYLRAFKAKVLLITDVETLYLNSSGELQEKEASYPYLSLPPTDREWTWSLAPIPEFSPDTEVRMKVAGIVLKKR